jgi:ParB family chromosome partitioning protein
MAGKMSPREKAALATQMMGRSAVPSPTSSVVQDAPIRQSNSVQIGLSMAGQGGKVKELEQELAYAKEALVLERDNWMDTLPSKKLDAKLVFPSKWANRDPKSFESPEFDGLKKEIDSAGGNVQPIKVRPIPGSLPQAYEVVFGHRRHRACFDLGLDVLAMIESIDDKELFKEMDRENRQRADLRPYEQGVMYKRALDEGLFSSLRRLADELGADAGNVSRAIQLAKLPEPILDAFSSRLDIQYRWASELTEALKRDADSVLQRARTIQSELSTGNNVSPSDSFNRLTAKIAGDPVKKPRVLKFGDHSMKISESKKTVSFEISRLPNDKLSKIERLIAGVLSE